MDNIIVITQNVKLESLHLLRDFIEPDSESVVFSTQLVFANEEIVIQEQLGGNCTFLNFSSLMNDSDFECCDIDAYSESQPNVSVYYNVIRRMKNQIVVERLLSKYPCQNRLLICDDLGLDDEPWVERGFKKVKCDYYHTEEPDCIVKRGITNKIKAGLNLLKKYYETIICEANFDGRKHLFFGSMNRIGYRMNLEFTKASRWESIKYVVQIVFFRLLGWFPKNQIVRMTTLHESTGAQLPRHKNSNVKIIQDGYLPPNYSSKYLLFHGKDTEFYTWDVEGCRTFEYHHLKSIVMPFRKKLYLPKPVFPAKIRKVLCVASGAGDWTAIKNRSDEDSMIVAFGKVASQFPDIEFIYRCHPAWIHPQHQGVNSINRAAEYIHWLNLPNLKISSNIPNASEKGEFRLSYKRSSFEEDLKDVDIVFGEHSVSMIDAGFKQILFGSVNVTGRRDLFCGISAMGFPHCESVEDICELLHNVTTREFQSDYLSAIKSYNDMTEKESL